MSAADEVARDHISAFNDAVATGSFDAFLTRFSADAVLRFENVPGAGTLEFAGLSAIAAAYREQPPDDQIDLGGQPRSADGSIVIPFTWRRDGGPGAMHIECDGELITRMTVVFE